MIQALPQLEFRRHLLALDGRKIERDVGTLSLIIMAFSLPGRHRPKQLQPR